MAVRSFDTTAETRILVVRVPAGRVEVVADADSAGSVELSAVRPGDAAAESAVAAAEVVVRGVRATVTVRAGRVGDVSDVGGGVYIAAGSTVVAGNIGGSGNVSFVGPGVVSAGGRAAGASGEVDVVASVRPGTEVRVITTSARVVTRGRLGAVEVDTVSGSVVVEHASSVEVTSVSGPVRAHVTEFADISATSADIALTHTPAARVHRAASVSGRIAITERQEQ